jgi:hypothetical protein
VKLFRWKSSSSAASKPHAPHTCEGEPVNRLPFTFFELLLGDRLLRAQIGVHRFYLGKIGTGFHVIVTGAGLGIWVLVHFIVILVSSFKDKEDRLLINWS